jgi:flavin reductase (DIM6/NTAB) family NADH-FMN oxidoreductase RutF
MFYDAVKNDHGFQYDPFKAIVVPRPIGWVSTVSAEGFVNLAPFSYFNAVAQAPHYVVLGIGAGKDSLRNIEATGEFAVNMATWDLREQMNATSAHVPHDVDEFDIAKLTACLECRLHQLIPLPDDEGKAEDCMVLGRVIGIHIDDRFIRDGRVDTAAMRPIARLGYSEYATVSEAWRMRRPD